MGEIEVPLEQVHEHVHHAVHHGGSSSHRMLSLAAVSTAILAVFAAISAMFAGHYANEAMLEQIKASNKWSHYQAKGIKLAITEMRNAQAPDAGLTGKIEGYKHEQEEIMAEANHEQSASATHLKQHETLAFSVTLFQVAIALSAIAVLTKKYGFVYGSLLLGVLGLGLMIKGFL